MQESSGSRRSQIPGVGAVVLAAGSSQRFGEDKLFVQLGDKPVLAWSLDIFQRCKAIKQIVLVLNEDNIAEGRALASRCKWTKLDHICTGGKRRQDSVKKGIENLKGLPFILIHDGARPFVSEDIIYRGIEAARHTGAAAAAVPVKDTIKMADSSDYITHTLNRSCLWSVQTPQIFHSDIIIRAYEHSTESVTDDASLVEKLGYKVKLYMGAYTNIKITTFEDIKFARHLAGEI